MENKLQDKNIHDAVRNALRESLQKNQLDAWLQPVADEFQGEYPAAYARRLQAVCGFSGSAGMGIFFANPDRQDVLLVDGRYTIQAIQEVPSDINVLLSPPANIQALLKERCLEGKALHVGFDPWLHTIAQVNKWREDSESGYVMWEPRPNMIDRCRDGSLEIPAEDIHLHPEALSGKNAKEKIKAIQDSLSEKKADACVLSLPDGICWLLNVRGADIDYNPLVLGYMIITVSGSHHWYVTPRSLDAETANHLRDLNVTLHPLASFWQHTQAVLGQYKRLMVDAAVCPYAVGFAAENAGCSVLLSEDPTLLPKACKTPAEIAAIKRAHIIDGALMCRALSRIESAAGSINELEVMAEIERARASHSDYKGASFATIAGSGGNGAIVHYHASKNTNRIWQKGELLLIDSGGQYECGTTDITRVLAYAVMDDEIKDRYTRVLKGHIALAKATFPAGTTGAQLDALARQFLWEIGCDYDHGTGHGIGAYLCVHEGPQSISKRGNAIALREGMALSNEPGYYKARCYGIRIENVVCVVSAGISGDGRQMLAFETITLVPIRTDLIDKTLMTTQEINWLNDYHSRVLSSLKDRVDESVKPWLIRACEPI